MPLPALLPLPANFVGLLCRERKARMLPPGMLSPSHLQTCLKPCAKRMDRIAIALTKPFFQFACWHRLGQQVALELMASQLDTSKNRLF